MRRVWLGVASMLSTALLPIGSASAADLWPGPPTYQEQRAAAPPTYNWSGFYVGMNGGGGFGNAPWASGPDGTTGTSSISNGLFGGTIGYNDQTIGNLVVGEEADLDWAPIKAIVPSAACAPGCEFKTSWLATARLRVGYAFDRFLPYVTAGVSITDFTADILGQPFGAEHSNNFSWTVGAGLEYAFASSWSAKIEYLYVDVRGPTCDGACGGGPISANLPESMVRIGLNYRVWMQ
jgi:outer membrane immunogenic protein